MKKFSKKSESKKQTEIITAVALAVLSIIFGYIAFSVPKVSNDYQTTAANQPVAPSFSSTQEGTASAENDYSAAVSDGDVIDNTAAEFPINLNTCTASDLMQIDNVGEVRANAIISYREFLGGYTSVEQLKNISGIGDEIYAGIEPYVTV